MQENPVLKSMLERKSIRRYKPDVPDEAVIEAVVRAGQQAPFAAQLGSALLSRDRERHPFQAPLLFTLLVDVHRLERVLAAPAIPFGSPCTRDATPKTTRRRWQTPWKLWIRVT